MIIRIMPMVSILSLSGGWAQMRLRSISAGQPSSLLQGSIYSCFTLICHETMKISFCIFLFWKWLDVVIYLFPSHLWRYLLLPPVIFWTDSQPGNHSQTIRGAASSQHATRWTSIPAFSVSTWLSLFAKPSLMGSKWNVSPALHLVNASVSAFSHQHCWQLPPCPVGWDTQPKKQSVLL